MSQRFNAALFMITFLPLWISVIFLDVISLMSGGNNFWTEVISITMIFTGFIYSSYIVFNSMKNVDPSEYRDYKILSVTQEKGITSEFLLSYILPLFVFDFTRWTGAFLFLVYFGVLSFLCIRNNNVYANLLFEVLGYKFYNCELKWKAEEVSLSFQAIMISRENLCAMQENTISATSLNRPFFIAERR